MGMLRSARIPHVRSALQMRSTCEDASMLLVSSPGNRPRHPETTLTTSYNKRIKYREIVIGSDQGKRGNLIDLT